MNDSWSFKDTKERSLFRYDALTNFGTPAIVKVCVDGSTSDRRAKKTIEVLVEGQNANTQTSAGKINDYTKDDIPFCRYVQSTQVWIKEREKGPGTSTGKFAVCF